MFTDLFLGALHLEALTTAQVQQITKKDLEPPKQDTDETPTEKLPDMDWDNDEDFTKQEDDLDK